MYKPAISAILKDAAEKEFVDDSIEHLQLYQTNALRMVLKLLWCPSVKFHSDLPEGPTPYTPSKFDEPGKLYSELRRMYLFLDPESNKKLNNPVCPLITPQKRQILWVNLLESLSPDDAALVDAMKDRKTPWKRISRHLTKKAFPGLIDE